MELKNALAVCLISLFSATLVVLIARSLDNQAASRLEPQLAQIVEELRSLRSQGGPALSPANLSPTEAMQDGLIVYYFHGDIRCPTCRAIESQAKDVVDRDFSDQLRSGTLIWRVLNYDKPESAELVAQFDVHMANVVLAKIEEGQVRDWKRLDEVWALYSDKEEFDSFVRTEISQMLNATQPTNGVPSETSVLDVPLPEDSIQQSTSAPPATDLPLPN